MLTSALEYSEKHSFSVIPVGRNKRPLLSWAEFQRTRAPREQIEHWWKRWPDANVGIVTGAVSGICVVDVDTPEGKEGIEQYLPDAIPIPTVQTPRGGEHLYFSMSSTLLGNKTGVIPGVDFRGEGGYVVAPPSKNGDGKEYTWLRGLSIDDVELPPLPARYQALVRSYSNIRGVTSCNASHSHMLTEGHRDDTLFRVAYALLKGGLGERDARQVIEILAQSCTPPFPLAEAQAKVDSALKRTGRRERNVSDAVFDWVCVTNGYFSITECFQALQGVSNNRTAVRVALHRLVERGILERWGEKDGVFRRLDTEAPIIDISSANQKPLPMIWPFEIERLVKLLPKSIIIVAGLSNSGKTGFLLNLALLNRTRLPVYYFSSEMGAAELKERLLKFDVPLEEWSKVVFKERSGNFADVIIPDALNIIDFLEIHDEFYKVSAYIKDIFERLRNGVAVIALQKNPQRDLGLGGERSLEKARLYLSMDKGRIKIVKGKNWASTKNPNGLERTFKLLQGASFLPTGDWA